MKSPALLATFSSLILLTGCGATATRSDSAAPPGPSAGAYATGLRYQDPGSSGFRLVRSAASTGTRLVLDLLGPEGSQGKGVAFFLTADTTKVSWVHPTGVTGSHVAAGTVLPLGSTPRLFVDKVAGDVLQAGLFQKGGAASTLGSAPIVSLALELKDGTVPRGAVALAPLAGKGATLLGADGRLTPISINLGTLTAE